MDANRKPLDLGPLKARCEKAWPGPWWADPHNKSIIWGPQHCLKTGDFHVADVRGWGALSTFAGPEHAAQQQDATGDFIASARQDLPLAIAEVEYLRGLLGGAREALVHLAANHQLNPDWLSGVINDITAALPEPGEAAK